jgi:hypothetical protein
LRASSSARARRATRQQAGVHVRAIRLIVAPDGCA